MKSILQCITAASNSANVAAKLRSMCVHVEKNRCYFEEEEEEKTQL